MKHKWDIRWEGRHWCYDEFLSRTDLLPESFRIEAYDGQIGFSDQERLTVLAMLLENLGLEKSFRFLLDISLQDGEISRQDFDLLKKLIADFVGDELPLL
ncbi:MAG: hypothetical protein HYX62_06510 [Gammaproteobacteria bacterium]|jgi:hypothetical protein|nr:hypothetical protein [Gammaproteobacteria bacterium]